MSDEALRTAERRFRDEATDAAAEAYLRELERTGAPPEALRAVLGRWGVPARGYTAKEILAQLDQQAEDYTFPMLDNGYLYPVDVCLTAYRDLTRWAIVIEQLAYQNRADEFGNNLCVVGEGGAQPGQFLYPLDVPEVCEHDEVLGALSEGARGLTIRGREVSFSRDPAWFETRGVTLSDPPVVFVYELMRALAPEHRDALLATEGELRRYVSSDLPEFLRLDAWFHPDLVEDELPSQCETFVQLADALVAGDPTRYAPTQEPNTHWSNWPDGGSL